MPLDQELRELERLASRIVEESGRGAAGFNAHEWIAHWVRETVPALGGERPLDVLAQPGGLERVRAILLRIESGAYS